MEQYIIREREGIPFDTLMDQEEEETTFKKSQFLLQNKALFPQWNNAPAIKEATDFKMVSVDSSHNPFLETSTAATHRMNIEIQANCDFGPVMIYNGMPESRVSKNITRLKDNLPFQEIQEGKRDWNWICNNCHSGESIAINRLSKRSSGGSIMEKMCEKVEERTDRRNNKLTYCENQEKATNAQEISEREIGYHPNYGSSKTKETQIEESERKLRPRKSRSFFITKAKRSRSFLRRRSQILARWFVKNLPHPYPSKSQKDHLAEESNMSRHQVSEWFGNMRRRIRDATRGQHLTWVERVQLYNGLISSKSEPLPILAEDSINQIGNKRQEERMADNQVQISHKFKRNLLRRYIKDSDKESGGFSERNTDESSGYKWQLKRLATARLRKETSNPSVEIANGREKYGNLNAVDQSDWKSQQSQQRQQNQQSQQRRNHELSSKEFGKLDLQMNNSAKCHTFKLRLIDSSSEANEDSSHTFRVNWRSSDEINAAFSLMELRKML